MSMRDRGHERLEEGGRHLNFSSNSPDNTDKRAKGPTEGRKGWNWKERDMESMCVCQREKGDTHTHTGMGWDVHGEESRTAGGRRRRRKAQRETDNREDVYYAGGR